MSFKYEVRWADVIVSSLFGKKKPDPAIWNEALRIGKEHVPYLKFGQMVYVDDVLRYCTAFAAHFPGAHAINFDGTKQPARVLRQALHELGVPFKPLLPSF